MPLLVALWLQSNGRKEIVLHISRQANVPKDLHALSAMTRPKCSSKEVKVLGNVLSQGAGNEVAALSEDEVVLQVDQRLLPALAPVRPQALAVQVEGAKGKGQDVPAARKAQGVLHRQALQISQYALCGSRANATKASAETLRRTRHG